MVKKTILVVQGDPHDGERILHALRELNMANGVFVVGDGEEALDFLFGTGKHSWRRPITLPDLVLLDTKSPKLSGAEVLKCMRSDPSTKRIPVIMLTSLSEDETAPHEYNTGETGYLRKPVEFSALANVVVQLGMRWMLRVEAPGYGDSSTGEDLASA